MFKHQDLQMLVPNKKKLHNFHPHEVVGSKTQLQVIENLRKMIRGLVKLKKSRKSPT